MTSSKVCTTNGIFNGSGWKGKLICFLIEFFLLYYQWYWECRILLGIGKGVKAMIKQVSSLVNSKPANLCLGQLFN